MSGGIYLQPENDQVRLSKKIENRNERKLQKRKLKKQKKGKTSGPKLNGLFTLVPPI